MLATGAAVLVASGLVAIGLGLTWTFLPHDVAWAGVPADTLVGLGGGRVAAFMVHDRVAFGGAVVGAGVLHLWLVGRGWAEGAWAWLVLAASATAGFVSVLSFLGFGYLDALHLVATLAILPLYAVGLSRSVRRWPSSTPRPAFDAARLTLALASLGLAGGGLSVLGVASTVVFVPQDLDYLGVLPSQLDAVSTRIVPLIAHDRAGFGGAVLSTGIAALGIALLGRPSASRWVALVITASAGFGTAVGIHLIVGYLDLIHLGPAIVGAGLFTLGLVLDGIAVRRGRRQLDQPAARRRDRRAGTGVLHELLGWRHASHDLLLEPGEHPADRGGRAAPAPARTAHVTPPGRGPEPARPEFGGWRARPRLRRPPSSPRR